MSNPSTDKPKITVSFGFLLGIYWIIPICLLAMLADRFWFEQFLTSILPSSPQNYFIFQILFGTPHIIASTIILTTNKGYLKAYRKRIMIFTILVLLFFGIGSFYLSYDAFLAIIGTATILHVINQQVGIGKGICRVASRIYDAWGITLILSGSVLYYMIFSRSGVLLVSRASLEIAFWSLTGLACILALANMWKCRTWRGKLYLFANTMMVVQGGFLYAEGYAFLAILGPRLVHDLTAFTFYVAHDVNRHGVTPRNWLYKLASKFRLGIFWVCPAFAVLLTYLIGQYADPLAEFVTDRFLGYQLPYTISFLLVGYLGLLHYFSEAFTWRSESPYRQHIFLK